MKDLSRRELLARASQISLSVAVGCTHSGTKAWEPLTRTGTPQKIIVIGAGIAGLTAARILSDAGHEVTILEARDRIGGRIWTHVAESGASYEFGASWIHGHTDNPLFRFCTERNIATRSSDDHRYPLTFDTDGNAIAKDRLEQIHAAFRHRLRKDLYRMQAALAPGAPDISLGSAVTKVVADLQASSAVSAELLPGLRHLIAGEIETAYAAGTDNISLRHWDKGHWYKGNNLLLPGGFARIPEAMARGLNVQYASVVTSVTATTKDTSVETQGGRTFRGDRVIVTLPLGVLKSGKVRFDPELPAAKKSAIERLGMGLFNKVYLEFDRAFWPEDPTWIEHVGADPRAWPIFFNYRKYYGRPILVAFIVGDFARRQETFGDGIVAGNVLQTLKKIALRNSWAYSDPVSLHITRWGSDPYSLGAYSFLRTGSGFADLDQVGLPAGDRIFFAGEATSSKNFMTAHAALLSGVRAAGEISRIKA